MNVHFSIFLLQMFPGGKTSEFYFVIKISICILSPFCTKGSCGPKLWLFFWQRVFTVHWIKWLNAQQTRHEQVLIENWIMNERRCKKGAEEKCLLRHSKDRNKVIIKRRTANGQNSALKKQLLSEYEFSGKIMHELEKWFSGKTGHTWLDNYSPSDYGLIKWNEVSLITRWQS